MHVPSHLSERLFRLFEPWVLDVLDVYPEVVVKNPAEIVGLSTNTVLARFRDAFISLDRYQWTLRRPCPNAANLREIRGSLSIVLRDGKIHVGPKPEVRGLKDNALPVQALVVHLHEYDEQAAIDIANAILTLHHHRVLLRPSTIHYFPQIDTNDFDVSISVDENNTATIT